MSLPPYADIVRVQIDPQPQPAPLIETPLPQFVAIELTCRSSTTAQLVREHIPACVQFAVSRQNPTCAVIDSRWFEDIYSDIPEYNEDDRAEVLRRAADAIDLVGAHIDMDAFTEFLGTQVTPFNLSRMAAELQEQSQRRAYAGLPTLIQLLRHVMGVEAAPCVLVSANARFDSP